MPTIGSSQLFPPKSWEEFEEICADLFMLEWDDRNLVRHGRQGQRQNGVDIYGNPKNQGYIGVQCKGKSQWPPTNLKKMEINEEITKALSFRPALSEFIFATTAPDDATIQDYVRTITERHRKKNLFSVHVLGWGELTRRLTCHPDLINKHYPYLGLNTNHEEIASIPQKTADIIIKTIRIPFDLIDNEINKQVEAIRKKRFFGSSDILEDARLLANQIQSGELMIGSPGEKSRALAWCARILSYKDCSIAENILGHASQLAQCEEIDIAAAFIIAAKGNHDTALANLASIKSPASTSAAFIIVANSQGAKKAFDWLDKTQLSFVDFDPDGKYFFLSKCIELEKWATLLECANTMTNNDFSQTPVLIFISAMANLVQAVHPEYRQAIVGYIPFDCLTFPLASDNQAISFIQKAHGLFEEYATEAKHLNMNQASNIAADFSLWLELRDPKQCKAAKEKLRNSMSDPAHSLRRLNFAIRFGIKLDLEAVSREIDQQTALRGGNSPDAAFARFVLAFTKDTPGDILDYINRYRDEISKHVNKIALGNIEVQMLARAGRVEESEQRLNELQQIGLDKRTETALKRIILEATGNDPLKARVEEYQADNSLSSLANLVDLLEEYNDLNKIIHYGTLLFELTHSLKDAERLAFAYNNSKQYTDLGQFLRKYHEFRDQSELLQALWCWVLYREGDVLESNVCLGVLRSKRDDQYDRALAINLAITSGNWENLASIIEVEWEKRDSRTPSDLLRTAQLAQMIESPRTQNLVQAAIQRAEKEPNIFLGAYSIAASGGWENVPEAIDWLPKAIEYSGDQGPIRRMSLKDILERKPDWDRRESDVWQKLRNGELPIFGVAYFLNRSLTDLFILPALANPNETDPRRRVNIFAYSGVRQPSIFDIKTIGFDATSLLTLTILGVLKKTLDAFNEILIPHSTLGWLFEEKKKSKFHQPSRIRQAKELRQLLDEGVLHPFICTSSIDSDLVAKIGEGLAALIAEAETDADKDTTQRIVVRSNPVHRISFLMDEEADLSHHQSCLCSCLAVVEKLKQKGQLTTTEEKKARNFLSANERKWPNEPEIIDRAVLYLDDLSINYLQHLGLLRKLKASGLTAIVSTTETNETKALIRYESLINEANQKIEELRITLAEGISTGKVKLGPLPAFQDDLQPEFRLHPTINIIEIAHLADIVIVDDRFMNQHQNLNSGSREVPIATSWDLISILYSLQKIDLNTMLNLRTKLRQTGFLLSPIDHEELHHYLTLASNKNGVLTESAEIKAIRENILQTRMAGVLRLPKEANWFSSLLQVIIRTIKLQWTQEIEDSVARARSNWLFQFLDIRGWAPAFGIENGSQMASLGYGAQIMLLLFPPENTSAESKMQYRQWIEDIILKQLKEENSGIFLDLVQNAKKLISDVIEVDSSSEVE